MIVALLLVVIGILLCTRRPGRDYTLGLMALIAGFIWLAIEIHLLSIVADFFGVAVQHWIQIVVALGAAILLIVPAIMIYIAIRDRFDSREKVLESHNPVRNTFERRVDTLRALGYGRTEAEATALRLLKRDFHSHPSTNLRTRIATHRR
ncbi:MAG: hypothetical protein WA172_19005 [Terriglobales bacterium]